MPCFDRASYEVVASDAQVQQNEGRNYHQWVYFASLMSLVRYGNRFDHAILMRGFCRLPAHVHRYAIALSALKFMIVFVFCSCLLIIGWYPTGNHTSTSSFCFSFISFLFTFPLVQSSTFMLFIRSTRHIGAWWLVNLCINVACPSDAKRDKLDGCLISFNCANGNV